MVTTFFKGLDLALSYICETQIYHDLDVFSSRAHQIQADGTTREQPFWVLETSISQSDSSLYSVLDNMIWADEEQPVYIDFADVVIFQTKAEAGVQGCAIDLPTALYLDRYTEPWLESVKEVKRKIAAQKSRINALETKEERLKSFRRGSTDYNPKALLELSIDHFASRMKMDPEDSSGDITMDSQPDLPDPTPLLKELLHKLEKKLLGMYIFSFHHPLCALN